MSDSPYAKIIFDQPATEDAFQGKGHERSAKALAESIKQIADEKDGAIGLEGTWGSGKSTVIEMATDALKVEDKRHDYQVFYFDLWTHHADEFKRAFLEEFVNWCEKKRWLKPDQLKAQRGRIRNRVKEVDTTNRKTFSVLGTILILLLPFLPIAVSWISPAAFNQSTAEVFAGFTWPEIILRFLFIAACIPILVIVAKVLADWVVWPVVFWHVVPWWNRQVGPLLGQTVSPSAGDKIRWDLPTFSMLTSDMLSLFSRESKKDTVTQNIRDEDPTTVEFYKVFRELVGLVQVGRRRVVFVLDNMDRLPIASVPATWSEVRAVFATIDVRTIPGNTRVTAVIPYDRAYVVDAFPKPATSSEKKSAVIPPPDVDRQPTEEASDEFRFAEGDVFNKTFSRILKVSPPIGSHWGKFLDAALVDAFGSQHSGAARNKLFRLLQLYLQRNLIHPTPRMIVGYVNEIGAYWTQWGNDIPVESIGLFVLLRSKIESSPEALTRADLVNERYRNVVDQKDWLEHLAALAFNVPVKDAAEVLLGDSIRSALLEKDSKSLVALSELSGFEKFFQHYLSTILEDLSLEDAKFVSRAAINVDAIKLSEAVEGQIWKDFARAVPSMVKLVEVPEEDLAGLSKIVEKQQPPAAEAVATILRTRISEVPGPGQEFGAGVHWASNVGRLSDAIKKVSGPDAGQKFWSTSNVPEHASFAVGVARQCSTMPDYRYADLGSKPALALMQETLEQSLSKETSTFRGAMIALAPLMAVSEKATWLTKIAEALRGTQRSLDEVRDLLATYILLDHEFAELKSEVSGALRGLVNDGTLLWYAHQASEAGDDIVLADAIFLMAKRSGSTAPAPGPHAVFGALTAASTWYQALMASGDLPDGAVDRLVDQVSETGVLPAWVPLAVGDKTEAALFVEIVGRVVALGRFDDIDLGALILQYDNARAVLGDHEVKQLLDGLGNAFDPREVAQLLTDAVLASVGPALVRDIAETAPTSSLAEILRAIDEQLKALSAEDWRQSLKGEDRMVSLLIARLKSGRIALPPNTFMEALQIHASSVLVGELSVASPPDDWDQLVSALTPASRKSLASRTLAGMPKSGLPADGVAKFVRSYRKLADALPLEESATLAVDVFLRALVSGASVESLEYVQAKSKDFKKALKIVDTATSASFLDVLDGLDAGDDASRNRSAAVRDALGLKKSGASDKK